MRLLLWIGLVVCVLAVAAVDLTGLGSKRWADRMAALCRGLESHGDGEADGTQQPTRACGSVSSRSAQ
jgi:hypothetical protein